jgi:hypothetical protein
MPPAAPWSAPNAALGFEATLYQACVGWMAHPSAVDQRSRRSPVRVV